MVTHLSPSTSPVRAIKTSPSDPLQGGGGFGGVREGREGGGGLPTSTHQNDHRWRLTFSFRHFRESVTHVRTSSNQRWAPARTSSNQRWAHSRKTLCSGGRWQTGDSDDACSSRSQQDMQVSRSTLYRRDDTCTKQLLTTDDEHDDGIIIIGE